MAKAKETLEHVRHDPTLERMVLSSIIGHHPRSHEVLDLLKTDDFFHSDHRKIFEVIKTLDENKQEIGLLPLYTEIEKLGDLEGENLVKFLSDIRNDVDKNENLLEAVKELRLLGMCRYSAKVLETAKIAINGGEDPIDEILDTTIDRLSESLRLYEEFDQQGITFYEAGQQTLKELWAHEDVAKIFTGIPKLDEMTGGFRPGELIVVTAETGSGKTLLAQQTRVEACKKKQISLFCSGEMWAKHLMRRELAAAANISSSKMRREEKITDEEYSLLAMAAAHQCNDCRILDGELSIGKIRRVARAIKARKGLHLLILDYDELIEAPGKDENEQMRRLVRTSKSIGMELNCAVMLISQLRKEYGHSQQNENDSRPPNLSRLYGSGAKVKHASLIILAERKWQEHLEGVEKEAVLWVLKNRDGQTGAVKATFNIQNLRFEGKS